MRRMIVAVIAAAGCVAISGVAASSAAAANTLGPPPWTGALCPAIGLDTGCQYGIDVTAVDGAGKATAQTLAEDGDQSAYDGVEDAMLVIKNDSSAPLSSLHMGISGSGQDLFGFDADGVCSGSGPGGTPTWTPPAGCPFGSTGYEGPGTTFTVSSTDTDSGTVNFSPALAPGQTTYFSLETIPNIVPTVGNDNNWPTSMITAPGQTPGTFVSVKAGTNVTDQVTINGPHGATFASGGAVNGDGSAAGTVTYNLFANDKTCSSTPIFTSTKTVTAGVAAPSDPVGAALAAGRYYWLESYSGDATNTPSQSLCGAEILNVAGVVTKLSATVIAPGTPVTDTATLIGAAPRSLTGTVSFAIYTDAACKVPYTAVPNTFSAVTPTNSAAKSAPISLPSGTYYWVASYSGDFSNSPAASACGAEVLHVANNNFTIVKKPKVGKGYKVSFTVAVFDPGKFSWSFTTPNKHGKLAADLQASAARKHCGKGKIKVKNKCVPAVVKYGSGSRTVAPGNVTVTITPSGKLRSALNKGDKLKLQGLLTFHSSYGGVPTSQTVFVTVHGKKPHHKKKKHH